MFQNLMSALEAVCGTMPSYGGSAMDFNAMNSGFNADLNAQMQACSNQIVQSNMNNPHVQQMYQSYLQQGGTLDFSSYCFRYAETGGFTQAGYANAMQTQAQIHAQDTANMNAYRQYSQQLQQETTDYRNAVQDNIARQRGENLSAQAPFVNSADGTTWQLPTNASPGQMIHDQASGNSFVMDIHGQYWMSNGQGWWQSMNYHR